jgi:hypothetical protein
MKVNGTGGVGAAGGPGRAKAASGEGFRLPAAGPAAGAAQVARTASAAGVMGVEALLALQDVGGPLERRKRAMNRAGRILDVLDEVKIGLLSGEVTTHNLQRLQQAIRDQREGTEDARLESLLDEIEVRAAVEMAKLESGKDAA